MPIKLLDRVRAIRGPFKGVEGWADRIWSDPNAATVIGDDGSMFYFVETHLNKIAMPDNLVNYPAARDQLEEIKTRIRQET